MVLVYRWIDTVHTSHVVLVTSQTSKEPKKNYFVHYFGLCTKDFVLPYIACSCTL